MQLVIVMEVQLENSVFVFVETTAIKASESEAILQLERETLKEDSCEDGSAALSSKAFHHHFILLFQLCFQAELMLSRHTGGWNSCSGGPTRSFMDGGKGDRRGVAVSEEGAP